MAPEPDPRLEQGADGGGERHQPLLAAFADHPDGGRVGVHVGQVQGDELGPSGAGQVGQADDGGVADAGRALVGVAVGEEGGQLGVLDVPAGGDAAAGHRSQVHSPQVVHVRRSNRLGASPALSPPPASVGYCADTAATPFIG